MATIDNVKKDYLAINRVAISDAQAQAFATAIDGGSITEAQFVSSQIAGAKQTTQAELATYSVLTGLTPSSAQLDSLVTFAKAQSASYAANGYQVNLAPFEALGAAIASDATTKAAFLAKYPTTLSNTDFIASVYTAVTGGTAPSFSGNPAGGETTNGDHFLAQLAFYTKLYTNNGLSAADAATQARGAIAGQITALPFIDASVAASSNLDDQVVTFLTNAAAGTAIYSAPLPASGGGVGTSFTLTTGVDTGPAFTGGNNNDTFTADNSQGAGKYQLTAADSINGSGGIDTLKVFSDGTAAGSTISSSNVTSIENIFINNIGANAFNASTLTGVTSLQLDAIGGSQTVTLAAQSLTLSNEGTGGFTTTVASTTDTKETITLSKFGAKGAADTIDLSGTKVTSVSIASTGGANNVVLTDTGAALATVTLTGDQNLSLAESIATVTKIDASAATGKMSVDISGVTTAANFSFTGGTGNDTLTLKAGELAVLTSGGQLDGGAGTGDTLAVNDATFAGATLTALNAVKGFEILQFNLAAGSTLDDSTITNTFANHFAINNVGTNTITNLVDGSIVDVLKGSGANTDTFGAALGASTITINQGVATSAGLADNLKVTGFSTVNLSSNGTAANTAAFTNSDNTKFVITGADDLTVTVSAGTATGDKVDASAFTGKLTVTGSNFSDVLIGGTGNDTITSGTNSSTLTGNAGADNFDVHFAVYGAGGQFDTITDFTKGADKITIVTQGTEVFNPTAVTVNQGGTFTAALNTAVNALATGAVNGQADYFVYGGNTYVVESVTAAHATVAATDLVVKLTGVVDLSAATITGHALA